MKRRNWMALIALVLLILMAASVALAAPGVAIDWWVMAGGGATAEGGGVTMNGTLGQPVIGVSEGEGVRLSAGYWAMPPTMVVYLPVVLR